MRPILVAGLALLLSGCASDDFHHRLYAFAHAGQGQGLGLDDLAGPLHSATECRNGTKTYDAEDSRRLRDLCRRTTRTVQTATVPGTMMVAGMVKR